VISEQCNHIICRDCAKQHIQVKVKDNTQIATCPIPKCKEIISRLKLSELFLNQEIDNMDKIILNNIVLPTLSATYCLTPNCDYAIILADGNQLDCLKCHRLYCISCKIEINRNIGHICGMDLDDFKKTR